MRLFIVFAIVLLASPFALAQIGQEKVEAELILRDGVTYSAKTFPPTTVRPIRDLARYLSKGDLNILEKFGSIKARFFGLGSPELIARVIVSEQEIEVLKALKRAAATSSLRPTKLADSYVTFYLNDDFQKFADLNFANTTVITSTSRYSIHRKNGQLIDPWVLSISYRDRAMLSSIRDLKVYGLSRLIPPGPCARLLSSIKRSFYD